MLVCIISLFHAVYTSSGYLDLFYAHCSHQITVCSVACNKLCQEGSNSDVTINVSRQCPQWNSKWLTFSVKFDFRVFPKTRPFCQPMERVYSCFGLTDMNVISSLLSVRKSVSSQELEPNFKVLSVSLCPPALNVLTPTGRIVIKFEFFILDTFFRNFKPY